MYHFHKIAFVFLVLPMSLLAQSTPVGGPVTNNATWSPAMGTVLVYSNVIVSAGATLTIQAGTAVRITNGLSISALAGSRIDAEGSPTNPITFLPMVGLNKWGTINASGANSFVTVRGAELAYGGINLGSQATGLIEDCYIHDVVSAIVANAARFVTMRRNHVKNYSETIFNSGTMILAEDSLYENMTAGSSDALEIQGGPPGSIVRRCTFRHSTGSNSDAVDFNGTSGALVEDCLIYDFTDKGISLGASGAGGAPDRGIIVRNCLIYGVDTGIAIKDGSTCGIYNTTIAGCNFGMRLYQKFNTPVDGGHVTNALNCILWGNTKTVDLTNNSSIVASYCNFQGTNWPGVGNINSNPLFLNSALRDYRFPIASPCAGTGFLGVDMGPSFAVGAAMALSHPRFESVTPSVGNVILSFWIDSEKSYSLQFRESADSGSWTSLNNFGTRLLPSFINATDAISPGNRIYRLVTPQQP